MGRPAMYPEQFREDALALVESSGRPIAEFARDRRGHVVELGPCDSWCATERAADPDALPESERDQLRRLAARTWSSARTTRS